MSKEPTVIQDGSVVLKIYHGMSGGKPLHTLVYYDASGQRVRTNFRDLDEAITVGKKQADALQRGQHALLKLAPEDAAKYRQAGTLLRVTRKPLNLAVAEYVEAWKVLAGAGSVLEAARFFARHHGKVKPMLVPEVARDFYERKKKDKFSPRYLEDIQARLVGRFAGTFAGHIVNITAREIEDWLDGLKVGGRTRNNYRNLVTTLFAYAKARGYLPKDRPTEAEAVPAAKEEASEIGILTSEQMMDLLGVAGKPLIPFLVLGGFAGLRAAEIERLEWKEINLKEGHIEIRAGNAKTSQRRIVPLLPNAVMWLMDYQDRTGLVMPGSPKIAAGKRTAPVLADLASMAEVDWPHNCLRHSFASYRLASVKSAAQVALEMGNSPGMIFRNYRELVTEKQAAEWFAINPEQVKKHMADKKAREAAGKGKAGGKPGRTRLKEPQRK